MTTTDVATPHVQSRLAAMGQPVPAWSLAVFRIALGALLVWDCWRFIRYDRIYRYFVAPEFHFTYPGFGWVAPLPDPWIHVAWLGMGAAAALVMLGLFYRVAIVVLTVLFAYFFLIDRAEYLNHFYLVILFLILMCFIPAHRVLSLDARFAARPMPQTVPYAAVFTLRAQMEIMLVFAGLVKITPDWLAGEPLGLWLRSQADEVPFGHLFQYDGVIIAAAWGTIALHLIGAPLLLWPRTRIATFLLYCVFHIANASFFNIGIFPWMTIAATTIFFAPDWPLQVARWLLARFETVTPLTPRALPPARPLPPLVVAGIAGWLLVQIALPLRAGLFPTEVRWTGDGHEFSWRMRIYDRQAEGEFWVTAADGTEWTVNPADYLSERQVAKMLVRPDMIHQFAAYLEEVWRANGHGDVVVRADIWKSLNGRPMQQYVDPTIDLTAVGYNLFGPDSWILPLDVPVWGATDNAAPHTDTDPAPQRG
jgi:vitamin K-dependent gamma-carboxylase